MKNRHFWLPDPGSQILATRSWLQNGHNSTQNVPFLDLTNSKDRAGYPYANLHTPGPSKPQFLFQKYDLLKKNMNRLGFAGHVFCRYFWGLF